MMGGMLILDYTRSLSTISRSLSSARLLRYLVTRNAAIPIYPDIGIVVYAMHRFGSAACSVAVVCMSALSLVVIPGVTEVEHSLITYSTNVSACLIRRHGAWEWRKSRYFKVGHRSWLMRKSCNRLSSISRKAVFVLMICSKCGKCCKS